MSVGTRIKEARKKAGYTQKEFSQLAGIAESMVGQYENGYRRPKGSTLEKIAKALNLDVQYFLDDRDDPDIQDYIVDDFCPAGRDLERKLRCIGFRSELMDNGLWVLRNGAGAEIPATEEELRQIDLETDRFLEFKIYELQRKKEG